MTDKTCPQEERVREALSQGSLTSELRAHIAACPDCREAAAAAAGMGRIREAALREFAAQARIPDARDILEWARSRPIPDPVDASKILKPLRIYRRFVLPAGLAAGIAAAALNAASLKQLLLSLPGLRTIIASVGSPPVGTGSAPSGLWGLLAGLGFLTLFVLAAATRTRPAER